jgi:hypothetical protein
MIKDFLAQNDELEAFLTGPAGSGKTTQLIEYVEELNKLNVIYKVVAYTHKAKGVLQEKLPEGTDIATLHSWLKKRPGINEKAKHLKALLTTAQRGKPEMIELLIVDEFSFIGEKDYFSIGELQDLLNLTHSFCTVCNSSDITDDGLTCISCMEADGTSGNIEEFTLNPLKVLYVGDLNQLPPIDGPSAVEPHGPFWTKLTKIHRTASPGLMRPLQKLVDIIEGGIPMSYLEPTNDFIRGVDIDKAYANDSKSKIMLAFTNKAVEDHNSAIQGRKEPEVGDWVYIPTFAKSGFDKMQIKAVYSQYNGSINTVNGIINEATKFNPVGFLNGLNYIKFYHFTNGMTVAGIFGSYQNKLIRDRLGRQLVEANKQGKNSKAYYREYKTISDFVVTMDFTHCMTIHKSQGSEYENVYVDSKDLGKCLSSSDRVKLLYVAISRARSQVFLNN